MGADSKCLDTFNVTSLTSFIVSWAMFFYAISYIWCIVLILVVLIMPPLSQQPSGHHSRNPSRDQNDFALFWPACVCNLCSCLVLAAELEGMGACCCGWVENWVGGPVVVRPFFMARVEVKGPVCLQHQPSTALSAEHDSPSSSSP